MWKLGMIVAAAGLMATQATAQDKTETFILGLDVFLAGQSVSMDSEGRDDVFLAGERVVLAQPISGAAHMAGRWLTLRGAVGDSVYAAGQSVDLEQPVAQDATLAGQEVTIRAEVSGDLRAFGSEIEITAPVGGTLLVAGEFVKLNAPVGGDMAVAAREIDFGEAAVVGGTLILYEEDTGTMEVPERVAPAERIERREIEEWEHDFGDYAPVRPRSILSGFLTGVVVIALLAAALAALAPRTIARWREQVLSAPGRSLLAGFVGLSALIGAGIVLAMTLIGMLLTPAAIFLAVIAGVLGYVVGAYALGVALMMLARQGVPDSMGKRALAAGIGALVAGLIGLIPFLGWLAVLALTLAGLGAVLLLWLRPRFFVAGTAA